MNLKRGMLVGLLTLTSLVPLAGCSKVLASTTDEGAAQTAPADAPVSAAAPASTTDSEVASATPVNVTVDVNMKQAPPPPALQFENPGLAPSAHHVWMRGFWRFDTVGYRYVWVPGFWQDRLIVATMAPPPPRREIIPPCAVGYAFVPGFWAYNGRAYVWYPGHFEARRVGYVFAGPRYVLVNGRYEYREGSWIRRENEERRIRDAREDGREQQAREDAAKRARLERELAAQRAREQKEKEAEEQARKDHQKDQQHPQKSHSDIKIQAGATSTASTKPARADIKTQAAAKVSTKPALPAVKTKTATTTTTTTTTTAPVAQVAKPNPALQAMKKS